MNKLINSIQSFMKDEEGLTVVEYVVGAGLLVIGLSGIFATFKSSLTSELDAIFDADYKGTGG